MVCPKNDGQLELRERDCPKTIKMLLWGDYEITTDQGGEYFQRNMMGVRGLATAGADLTVWHGMQLIKQAGE